MSKVCLTVSGDQVATITLHDVACRNAMGLAMAADFEQCIRQLAKTPGIRAAILTGAGSCFAAGGDLQMLQEKAQRDRATNARDMMAFYRSFLCILDLPFPVIAAVQGHAIGAGLCIALACDALFLAEEAKLAVNFTRIGLHPGMAATYFLPKRAGLTLATEWLLTGRVFTAKEGACLANAVLPRNEVADRARQFAESMLRTGPAAVTRLLQTLRPNPEQLTSILEREAETQAQDYLTPDFQEGIAAALEKRPARFD